MQKGAQAYFSTHVSTTDQGQLLLMLYDGALKFLAQAREKMLARDMAGKGILISKVIDIVNELTGSLNMEKGGTLAQNLNNLYFLCTTRLLQANAKLDVAQLDSVTAILSGLRGAYAQILDTPEAKAAVAQISARRNPQDALVTGRTPVAHNMPAPSAGMGRLQAQAAYGALHVGVRAESEPPFAAAPQTAAAGAPPPPSVEESRQTSLPAAAPVPPPAQTGFGRGFAMYGKLTVRG